MLATAVSLLLAIHTPPGLHVDIFARDLERPRMLAALDDGTLLVSRPELNDVVALRDRDGDGRADEIRTALASIDRAHGLAMHGRTLYVAGVKKIVAAERLPDGSFSEPVDVVTDLPDGGRNPHRTIAVGPDGLLYVSIAGTCDDCTESNPEYATLLQVNVKDGRRRIYARGLRNLGGFGWHPETGELWGAENGMHRIGDGLDYARARAALALPAQSSLVFARDGDAFSASPGNVARIRYRDGKPVAVEELVSGIDGQLGGIAAGADGTLFVSDTRNGIVYRIAKGDALPPPMTSSAAAPVSTAAVLAKVFHLGGLRSPDSVLHDEEQDVYFVSNVDGALAEKDGKGFISRVAPDGRVEEATFINGLDAPKGMAIRGIELWVADIDRVRVFDRLTGAPLRTIDLTSHGAVFLHDLAVGGDDSVYVTDSDVRIKGTRERLRTGDGRIYRIENDGDVEIAAQGEELRAPSGIVWDGLRFLVAQSNGNEVLAWSPGGAAKAVMRGPGAFDGIVVLPSGAVIVSSQHDEGMHVAIGGGELRPLFTRKPSPAGIGFDRKRNRLLVPSPTGDWLEGWTLPPMEPRGAKTSSRDTKVEAADAGAYAAAAASR